MTTTRNYDNLNRLTSIGTVDYLGNPLGSFGYTYNPLNQRSQTTAADGTQYQYAYDLAGRLNAVTDQMGQVTNYSYFADGDLKETDYTQTERITLSVKWTYDPSHNRIASMNDGHGTTNYWYNPYGYGITAGAGKLNNETRPKGFPTIFYSYDALGRTSGWIIGGGEYSHAGEDDRAFSYDSIGRLSSTGLTFCNGIADFVNETFNYGYLNATTRLVSITSGSGPAITMSYYPNVPSVPGTGNGDERLQEIVNKTNDGSATLSRFDYTYNPVGDILSWTQQTDSNPANPYNLQYDAADQLLQDTSTSTHAYSYQYDPAGNRSAEQIDTSVTSASYNNLNQLTATRGSTQIAGKISQPGTVTIGGNPAIMTGTTFAGSATLTSGTNRIPIIATGTGGVTTGHIVLTATAASGSQAFTYDLDGNLLSDGTNTYEWDAANRLAAVNEPGGVRSEFVYDGLNRRTFVMEFPSGRTDAGSATAFKKLVWIGNQIVQERDDSGNVNKNYFADGVRISGTTYYYTKDHLGSVRELVDASGTIHARYDYDPYRRRTKVSGDLDTDFGYAGYYFHAPSGLDLTLYRAYNPNVGRWLSRDPLGDPGFETLRKIRAVSAERDRFAELSQGPDLYLYVHNGPLTKTDLFGLDDCAGCLNQLTNCLDDMEMWKEGFAGSGIGMLGALSRLGTLQSMFGMLLVMETKCYSEYAGCLAGCNDQPQPCPTHSPGPGTPLIPVTSPRPGTPYPAYSRPSPITSSF